MQIHTSVHATVPMGSCELDNFLDLSGGGNDCVKARKIVIITCIVAISLLILVVVFLTVLTCYLGRKNRELKRCECTDRLQLAM